MVERTTKRLMELKENINTGTWFKNHSSVFSDDAQLGAKNIVVTEEEKSLFLHKVYRPYVQSVVVLINRRMESPDLISAMSIFDPRHLPTEHRKDTNPNQFLQCRTKDPISGRNRHLTT